MRYFGLVITYVGVAFGIIGILVSLFGGSRSRWGKRDGPPMSPLRHMLFAAFFGVVIAGFLAPQARPFLIPPGAILMASVIAVQFRDEKNAKADPQPTRQDR